MLQAQGAEIGELNLQHCGILLSSAQSTEEEAQRLLDLLEKENIRVFYARIPASFGMIHPEARD